MGCWVRGAVPYIAYARKRRILRAEIREQNVEHCTHLIMPGRGELSHLRMCRKLAIEQHISSLPGAIELWAVAREEL